MSLPYVKVHTINFDSWVSNLFANTVPLNQITCGMVGWFADNKFLNTYTRVKYNYMYVYIQLITSQVSFLANDYQKMVETALENYAHNILINKNVYDLIKEVDLDKTMLDLMQIPNFTHVHVIDTDYTINIHLWFKQLYPLIDASKIDFKNKTNIWETLHIKNSNQLKNKKLNSDFAPITIRYDELVAKLTEQLPPITSLGAAYIQVNEDDTDYPSGRVIFKEEDYKKGKIGLIIYPNTPNADIYAYLHSRDGSDIRAAGIKYKKLLTNNYFASLALPLTNPKGVEHNVATGTNKILHTKDKNIKMNAKSNFSAVNLSTSEDKTLNKNPESVHAVSQQNGKFLAFTNINLLDRNSYNLLTIIKYPFILDCYHVKDLSGKVYDHYLYTLYGGYLINFIDIPESGNDLGLTTNADFSVVNMILNTNKTFINEGYYDNHYYANITIFIAGEGVPIKSTNIDAVHKAYASKDPKKVNQVLQQVKQEAQAKIQQLPSSNIKLPVNLPVNNIPQNVTNNLQIQMNKIKHYARIANLVSIPPPNIPDITSLASALQGLPIDAQTLMTALQNNGIGAALNQLYSSMASSGLIPSNIIGQLVAASYYPERLRAFINQFALNNLEGKILNVLNLLGVIKI